MDVSVEQGVFDNVDVRLMQAGEQYVAELVLPNGTTYADVLPAPDCEALGSIEDPRQYGGALFDWLFPGGDVAFAQGAPRSLRAGLEQAFWESQYLQERSLPTGGKMRLRLTLDPSSRVLHKLWWETLYAREVGELALRMAVTRQVSTGLGRLWPVSEPKLRLLVVTSNPAGLDKYGCQPVDESFEKMLLGKALGPTYERMELERLTMASTGRLAERLRTGPPPHIVYLLAHAVYDDSGEGRLLFCDSEGYAHGVPFSEIAKVLAPADSPPRLVFLALPLTARVDYDNTLATLGPAIVSAGVQSVVAVHAPFPEDMLIEFSEVFFQNLVLEGQAIEKATMLARRAIFSPGHWGWAYPVLYLGTPDGTLFQPLRAEVEEHFRSVARRLKA